MTKSSQTAPLILVVDDDEAVLEALADFLAVTGYRVAAARNGRQALDYLHKNPPPALVVHDLVMPVMDGWRLRKEMKQDAAMARLPVVVISALADHTDIQADAVLVKPFNIEQFLRIVERLTHPPDDASICSGGDPG